MFPSQKWLLFDMRSGEVAASMGPGCFHPRNQINGGCGTTSTELQWGRDVSIPEILEVSQYMWRPAKLQWGRDVSIPEIPRGRLEVVDVGLASMGPGCFHPRNAVQLAAPGASDPASMGPGCFHPRNAADVGCRTDLWPASMGPGCFHPRNDRTERRRESVRRASMGPGCFHPRNPEVRPGTTCTS